MKMKSRLAKGLVILLAFCLLIPFNAAQALAASADTKIVHDSPGDYLPGFRVKLQAKITDSAGVMLARLYFKSKKAKQYIFVDMKPTVKAGIYQGVMPAPWVNSEYVEYVFVVVNQKKLVVRSEVFKIEEEDTDQAGVWKDAGITELRLDIIQEAAERAEAIRRALEAKYGGKLPNWQELAKGDVIDVETELPKNPKEVVDFYDKIALSEAPASAKYGLLAEGLYTPEQIAAAGGVTSAEAATGAVSAGVASSGVSTALIGGLLVAAAVGGGAAAAGGGMGGGDDGGSSGGGGGGSSTPDGPKDVGDATAADFVGRYTGTQPRFDWNTYHAFFDFRADGTGTVEEFVAGQGRSLGYNWTWTQGSKFLDLNFSNGARLSGTVSGNTDAFTLNGFGGGGNALTINFTK
jgi:hypothetical protein